MRAEGQTLTAACKSAKVFPASYYTWVKQTKPAVTITEIPPTPRQQLARIPGVAFVVPLSSIGQLLREFK
jgi:hypothetical protein